MKIRVEQGPKGKKSVAYSVDWIGLQRGAKTDELAIQHLEQYRLRYQPVADLAGLGEEFAADVGFSVVETYQGTGSTDFWGIAFAPSPFEKEHPYRSEAFERDIRMLQACWTYFDGIAESVSAVLKKGPRGGGRDRDQIIRHVLGWEQSELARHAGLTPPDEVILSPAGLSAYRKKFVDALRILYEKGDNRIGRKGVLSHHIRHVAFHVMDHAWEMQDKDLTESEP